MQSDNETKASDKKKYLTERFGSKNVKDISAGGISLFEIKAPFLFNRKNYEESKLNLFKEYISQKTKLFIRCSDLPQNLIWKDMDEIEEETWLIPHSIDIDALYRELYRGGWEIYSSDKAISRTIWKNYDIYNSNNLTELIRGEMIKSIIVSFFDNDPWIFYEEGGAVGTPL